MGYKLAGYELVGNCEIDPGIINIYRKNHHPAHSYLMDVRDFYAISDDDMPPELFDLDILDGSPPCSVFSMAGKREDGWGREKKFREGQQEQRLDDLFFWFIKIASKLRPRIVVAENVSGLLRGNAKGYVNEIIKAYGGAGYDVQIFQLNAARMGVPQTRERVFFIGRRRDIGWPAKLCLNFNEPLIPFGEVRSPDGKPMGADTKTGRLLARRKATDKSLADINKRLSGKDVGFTNMIISDHRVCCTIASGGSYYRMFDGKGLSREDFVNVQTFPQDYDFGAQNAQYVCGMSVPPVMMAQISAQIYEQWLYKI